jgi:ferredoxin
LLPEEEIVPKPAVPLFRIILETPDGTFPIECAADEYIWDAAAGSGITLPAICHQGQCLTCAGKLIAGEVDQSTARQYFPEDRAAGFVLLCRAWPRSDLRIRTHQQWEMRRHRTEHGLAAPYG